MRKYLVVAKTSVTKAPAPAKKASTNSSPTAAKKPPPSVAKAAADTQEPEEP
jgi:hypothetical protein